MPRTPIDPDLVHRAPDVARTADAVARVCAAVEPGLLPLARAALAREASDEGAGAWIEQARAALAGVLADPSLAAGLDAAASRRALAAALADAAAPSDDDAREHANGAARALVSSWVAAIDAALADAREVALGADLLPRGEAGERARARVRDALEPFALRDDAAAVLAAARDALAREAAALGVELERTQGGFVARRAGAGDALAEDVVESGARLRDGADEVRPPGAEAPAGTPRRR